MKKHLKIEFPFERRGGLWKERACGMLRTWESNIVQLEYIYIFNKGFCAAN
jgi:hypothetical protein